MVSDPPLRWLRIMCLVSKSQRTPRTVRLISFMVAAFGAKKASDKKGTGFLHYVMESDVCTSYTISAVVYYHII